MKVYLYPYPQPYLGNEGLSAADEGLRGRHREDRLAELAPAEVDDRAEEAAHLGRAGARVRLELRVRGGAG